MIMDLINIKRRFNSLSLLLMVINMAQCSIIAHIKVMMVKLVTDLKVSHDKRSGMIVQYHCTHKGYDGKACDRPESVT